MTHISNAGCHLLRKHPETMNHLSQAVSIDITFPFEVMDFREKLKDALAPLRAET